MKLRKLLTVLLALTCTFQAGAVQISAHADGAVVVASDAEETESTYGNLKYIKSKINQVNSEGNTIAVYSLRISGVEDGTEHLVIPEEIDGVPVTSIGVNAFQDCSSLVSVQMPNSITTIGKCAFQNCVNLEEVNLSAALTTLVSNIFEGCTSLKSISIPESVTNMGMECFQGCTSLKEVTIPDSVQSMSARVFKDCSALESVTLPKNLKAIPSGIFWNCTNLKSITIPESVETIDTVAFQNCTSLTEIQIPDCVSYLGIDVFEGSGWLENQPDGAVYLNHILYCYKGTIPETTFTISENVKYIAPYAFKNQKNLESVIIPQGVETIGYSAFFLCTELKTIQFPDSLKTVQSDAFSSTPWYEEQPDGVVYAGNYAWAYKGEMPEDSLIVIQDGTTVLDPDLFKDRKELTGLILPDGLTTIYGDAFTGCENLEMIRIPDSIATVGHNAFEETPWFAQQPDGLLYIGSTAYCYKGDMPEQTEITLREGTLSVAPYAFVKCENLVSITFPEGLQDIGRYAFYACRNLTEITLPESVRSVGSVYDGQSRLIAVGKAGDLTVTILNPFCEFVNDYTFPRAEKTLIRGYADSTAQVYAEEKGFTFESLGNFDPPEQTDPPEEKKIRMGDIDLDDEITILDVVMGNRVFVGVESVTPEQRKAYDVNHSGSIDLADSMLVLQYLVHLIDSLDDITV